MLLDDIKKANLIALKNRDKDARAVLSIVITKYQLAEVEAKSKGQELKDDDLLSIIQKVLKELSDEKEGYSKVGNTEKVESIDKQVAVLKDYLPKQLSEDEIRSEINNLEDKSIPSVMKYFKMNYGAKVNMALVSKIAKEYK